MRSGPGLVTILLAALLGGCAQDRRAPPEPLAIYGSTATLEIAPVLLAARDHYPPGATVRNGGIANLVGEAGGLADVATHAETQALRYSVAHPEIRILLTVTEGRYRIVARRSAGIASLSDLRGRRIATLLGTSAGYFLARMLAGAGLGIADVQPVRLPVEAMAPALARGEIDAVAIWEPHAGNAARVLGEDRAEFSGDGVYRELFNLNTTAAALADPDRRRRIVAFVRAILAARAAIGRDAAPARALVGATAGFSPDEVARAWPTLDFPAALPPDLLDTLLAEEKWLAAQEARAPRSRETLSRLIDPSILAEALRR